jgi:hypothetical protein
MATVDAQTSPESVQPKGRLHHWCDLLMTPVDGASLAAFRILFGALMVWDVFLFFANGWIASDYIEPAFYFAYLPFVAPLPGNGMYAIFFVMGLAALFVALGMLYRLAAAVFCLLFTYVFLLDKTYYLNHYYLICLISFLMIIVPAHRVWSIDRLIARHRKPEFVPRWSLWLPRGQVSLVYFYGGIAKLNSDWLRGQPMISWMAERSDLPVIGPIVSLPSVAVAMSYCGLAIDLALPFLLNFRRTFWIGVIVSLLFNLLNRFLFSIGVFPLMMLATLVLFYPRTDWPRLILQRIRNLFHGGAIPAVDAPLSRNRDSTELAEACPAAATRAEPLTGPRVALLGFIHFFALLQLVVPLRHALYPGDVAWTEEGHRFSWRMKLREKTVDFRMTILMPSSGRHLDIEPDEWLAPRQTDEMVFRPDMILQFAHIVADEVAKEQGERPRVYVDAKASLNSRPEQQFIDPSFDLAAEPIDLRHKRWIVPLLPAP